MERQPWRRKYHYWQPIQPRPRRPLQIQPQPQPQPQLQLLTSSQRVALADASDADGAAERTATILTPFNRIGSQIRSAPSDHLLLRSQRPRPPNDTWAVSRLTREIHHNGRRTHISLARPRRHLHRRAAASRPACSSLHRNRSVLKQSARLSDQRRPRDRTRAERFGGRIRALNQHLSRH